MFFDKPKIIFLKGETYKMSSEADGVPRNYLSLSEIFTTGGELL